VSQFVIKPVYTILNSCNLYLTIQYLCQIQHNTVVYFTLNLYSKGVSTALTCPGDICVGFCITSSYTYICYIVTVQIPLLTSTYIYVFNFIFNNNSGPSINVHAPMTLHLTAAAGVCVYWPVSDYNDRVCRSTNEAEKGKGEFTSERTKYRI
jgi:hypothetical protein